LVLLTDSFKDLVEVYVKISRDKIILVLLDLIFLIQLLILVPLTLFLLHVSRDFFKVLLSLPLIYHEAPLLRNFAVKILLVLKETLDIYNAVGHEYDKHHGVHPLVFVVAKHKQLCKIQDHHCSNPTTYHQLDLQRLIHLFVFLI
jgi:hypothetical protein